MQNQIQGVQNQKHDDQLEGLTMVQGRGAEDPKVRGITLSLLLFWMWALLGKIFWVAGFFSFKHFEYITPLPFGLSSFYGEMWS